MTLKYIKLIKGLDLKDFKILYELDKNSRASLTEIAKKTRLSKEVVFHRINKLIEKGYILRFQAVISTYRIGYQSYKIYLKLQNLTKVAKQEIQEYLLKNKNIFWIGNCQGKWDLIIAAWAKNVREFSKIQDEILGKLSNYVLEKEISISSKSIQFNRRWFYAGAETIETTFGEELEPVKVDDIDLKILEELALNSRIKIVDLAEKLGITVAVVIYRIKQLEKNKVITGYKIALDPKKMNYETCKAFIYLKEIKEERKNELLNYIKSMKNALNIVLTAGRWEMEIEFEVKNFKEYYVLMAELQEKFSDIIKTYDSVVLVSEPKQFFMPKA
ncbi:MAG: Lrp/AsnC family transcriptional regulator [Candidatus Pacearchaeota archaeon]